MKEAAQITNNNIGSNSQPATAPELEDIKQFLSARISNPPTLEETANRLGVSGRTLRRRFNQWNTHFQQELDAIRKEVAESKLKANDCGITDIAVSLGFCDSSAFSKAFKKWAGLSPREFKKKHLN